MMLGGTEQKLKATMGISAEAHVKLSVYLQSVLLWMSGIIYKASTRFV